jgi:hypothetical protein
VLEGSSSFYKSILSALLLVEWERTDERDIPGGVIDVDCSDYHVSDGRVRLGHEGQNRAGSSIWVMESLVVDDDSRRWWNRYWRHRGGCISVS